MSKDYLMNKLTDDIIFFIYQYLKPKELCVLALVSVRFKAIETKHSEILWKKFLHPTIPFGYKNAFFKIPFARIYEQIMFKSSDTIYKLHLDELEATIRPFENSKVFDLIKAKIAVLKLIKTNFIYVGLVLYHPDARIRAMINSVFLKNLVLFHKEAIDYILSHPDPEISKHIDYYLAIEMVRENPACLEKIINHPRLSFDSYDLDHLIKLGGGSGAEGSLSAR